MVTSKNKYNSYSNWEARLPMQSLGVMKVTLMTAQRINLLIVEALPKRRRRRKKKKVKI